MALLELRNVSRFFGKLAALTEVNLEIRENELVGLVGPNGSGKTTLFNVVSGFYRPSRGEIRYDGRRITGLRPDRISAMGLVRTFQSNILYKEATVLENLIRGYHLQARTNLWQAFFGARAYRREEMDIIRQAREALEYWGLTEVSHAPADQLPHGHQRILGLAMAMAADPKLLLLDEPVAGLSGEETREVMEHVRELAERGITIVLVEHHVKTVLSLCRRLVVLDYGRKIADGTPEEVTSRKEVIEAYLGTEEGSAP